MLQAQRSGKRLSLKRWRKVIRGFKAASCADDSVRIEPIFSVDPWEPGCAVLGVLDRLALAADIEELLNQKLGVEKP